ncbi:hypothetical protein PORCAN_984 [Porphyromonas crevioricanis JCM 13913]|nr:hypothetical protein PORCAN_984 [Porphyromonas crevioricanis JCM 13913]
MAPSNSFEFQQATYLLHMTEPCVALSNSFEFQQVIYLSHKT